jgi:hypothetical protein
LLAHQASEVLAPVAQHVLVDVQPAAVLAFGFDDQVDVGVLLMGVQHHGVAVLEGELLAGKVPSGGHNPFRAVGDALPLAHLEVSSPFG